MILMSIEYMLSPFDEKRQKNCYFINIPCAFVLHLMGFLSYSNVTFKSVHENKTLIMIFVDCISFFVIIYSGTFYCSRWFVALRDNTC